MANVVEIVVRTTDMTGPGRASVIAGAKAEAKAVAASAKEQEAARSRAGDVGKKVALGVTLAALAVGVVSTRMAADWQAQMVRLSTSAGESGSLINNKLTGNLALVSRGLLNMAKTTGTSTDELAKGMYMVESAGFHGAAGLTVMQAAAEGAKAEGAPLQEMGNALTSMMNSYHLKASQATAATNQMVASVAAGKMKMADLAGSISTVLPIAAAAGLSFGQVGGGLATLTAQGVSANKGTQMLAFTIRSLIAPNKVAQKEMSALGLSATDLATHLGSRGLTGTMDLVYAALKKKVGHDGLIHEMVGGKPVVETMDAALKKVMGGAVGLNTALLLGGTHAKTFSANVASVTAAAQNAGQHVKGWDEIQGTFNQRLAKMIETVKVTGIQIGTVLIPIVSDIMGKIVTFSAYLSTHTALLKTLAVVVGVVVVAGFYAWAASATAAAVATIAATWPILAIIAVVALLATGFMYLYNHCETFRKGVIITVAAAKLYFSILLDIFMGVVNWIKDHWSTISAILFYPIKAAVAMINIQWQTMKAAAKVVIDALIYFFVTLPNQINNAVGNLRKLLFGKGQDVINGLWDGLKDIWNKLTGWISGLGGWIKDHKGPMSIDRTLLKPAGHAIMNSLWDGLKAGAGPIGGWLSSFTSMIGGAMGSAGGHGSGVERWRGVALQALALTHSPLSWIDSLLARMQRESGGNPTIQNNWDSNAKAGTPSIGLMQTIMPTFLRYAGGYASLGITNPLANIIASINYANAAYGSAPRGWNRAGGYDRGGWLMPGTTLATNLTGRPEPVGWGFMHGLSGRPVQLEIIGGNTGPLETFIGELIRRFVRVRGGNVQTALGS